MAQFYRKKGDLTIYQTYDPKTGVFGGGIAGGEAEAQRLGVIPDWEASWKSAGAMTNIQTITPQAPITPYIIKPGETTAQIAERTGLPTSAVPKKPTAGAVIPNVLAGAAKPDFETMTGEQYLAAGLKGGQPTAAPPTGGTLAAAAVSPAPTAPVSPIASIQKVFGSNWQPASAFTPELQKQGIYGAVRIVDADNKIDRSEVYTIGSGGGWESQATLELLFGTTEQEGIVGEISIEQAKQLGINVDAAGKPPAGAVARTTLPSHITAGVGAKTDVEVGTGVTAETSSEASVSINDYQDALTNVDVDQTDMTPTDLIKAYGDMLKGAFAPYIEAAGKYVEAVKDRPSAVEEYRTLEEEAGLPGLKGELVGLTKRGAEVEAQIEALPDDIKKRVRDFLITETQYKRLTKAEAEPLAKVLNALSRARETTLTEIQLEQAGIANVMKLWETDVKRKEDALKAVMEAEKIPMQIQVQLAEAGFKAGLSEIEYLREAPERAAKLDLITAQIQKLQAETISELIPEAGEGEELLSPTEAATLGVPYGTTKAQAAAQGIIPARWKPDTGDGKAALTQTQLNKFAAAEIPNNVALNIQENLNAGATLDEIRTGLTAALGGNQELAFSYLDRFMEIVQKSTGEDLLSLLLGIRGE